MTDEPSWLERARGYIDLGMFSEAWQEIQNLPPHLSGTPDAQEMRIIVMLDRGLCAEALSLSENLCDLFPENHAGFIQGAYCLHAMGDTEAAIEHLQSGPGTLREEPVYFYNLACYELALGRDEPALTWLQRALSMGGASLRQRALDDPDLRTLRHLIEGEEA
jgi:predicted Zn-dependent protease